MGELFFIFFHAGIQAEEQGNSKGISGRPGQGRQEGRRNYSGHPGLVSRLFDFVYQLMKGGKAVVNSQYSGVRRKEKDR